jgi:hypothetical protein
VKREAVLASDNTTVAAVTSPLYWANSTLEFPLIAAKIHHVHLQNRSQNLRFQAWILPCPSMLPKIMKAIYKNVNH